ncbi:hypothetical protein FJZ31_28170 [Candidatus Poribacteria bacterium]|nr:hypothetical protein [Candidatus Poribacteria bacterium]
MNRRKFLKTAAGLVASASFALPALGKNTSKGKTMTEPRKDFILADVPRIENTEFPDIFTDALRIAISYQNEEIKKRFSESIYDRISGFSGRGWLIGFDDACFYWEKYGRPGPHESFAVSGLETLLEHPHTMLDALEFLGYLPEFLWNEDCQYKVDKEKATGFINMAEKGDNEKIRQYVTTNLVEKQRPVIALLHLPGNSIVDFALLTGYESHGQTILGRSPHQNEMNNSGEYGYFRRDNWEREVLTVIGVGEEREMKRNKHPCFIAIQNALKYSKGYTQGTRHYGLSAYDAWERAILDDENILGMDNDIVSRRFVYHILLAGFIASQKAFTTLPDCNAPSMGVINGYVKRAQAGPELIHGLMWDVWHVIGLGKGFLKGLKVREDSLPPYLFWDDDEDIRLFKDRAVREKIARIINRARQVDVQAIQDLSIAKEEWEKCRGRGNDFPCPCLGKSCTRV